MIAWVGIFGSVQRGTQRLDSDADFLIGLCCGRWLLHDVCSSYLELKRLSDILCREVNVEVFTQQDDFACVHMEALLTAQTVWGDPSWKYSSGKAAERQLREGYETTKKALQVASLHWWTYPSTTMTRMIGLLYHLSLACRHHMTPTNVHIYYVAMLGRQYRLEVLNESQRHGQSVSLAPSGTTVRAGLSFNPVFYGPDVSPLVLRRDDRSTNRRAWTMLP